jgi:hypothetical protein
MLHAQPALSTSSYTKPKTLHLFLSFRFFHLGLGMAVTPTGAGPHEFHTHTQVLGAKFHIRVYT